MVNYYIHDSNDWVSDCTETYASIVSTSSTVSDATKYTASPQKTEIEIQEYISDLQTYIFGLIRINPSLMNSSANQISSDSTKITYDQKGPNQNRELIPSRNKPLCQLVADLNSLITTFNSVINTSQNPYDMTKKNPIHTLYNENINLRNELQEEINRIYGKKNNSKLYLDSIVYTSVLWTILATTILFYIFKKL